MFFSSDIGSVFFTVIQHEQINPQNPCEMELFIPSYGKIVEEDSSALNKGTQQAHGRARIQISDLSPRNYILTGSAYTTPKC